MLAHGHITTNQECCQAAYVGVELILLARHRAYSTAVTVKLQVVVEGGAREAHYDAYIRATNGDACKEMTIVSQICCHVLVAVEGSISTYNEVDTVYEEVDGE